MIVISQNLVLAPAGEPLNTPVFGWRSMATAVAATTEAEGFPADNVLNPSTVLRWRAEDASPLETEYLTFTIEDVGEQDYVAIAGHNLGSAEITVSIEGATQEVGSPPELDWQEIVEEVVLPDDGPTIFRFPPSSYSHIRLKMQPGKEAPTIAVVYVGKLLVCERGTGSDHVPINFGRVSNIVNGQSESGAFLGRIILSEKRQTSLSLQHIRASWYRQQMDKFIAASMEAPFFVAWRPQDFPRDVGYCWMTNQPQPTVSFETGRISINLQMAGVAA